MNERIEELMSIICEGQNSIQREEVENYINNLQSKIDKAIEYIEENISFEMDDFTKIDIGCEILKILDLDKYNEFLKENK